MLDRPVSSIIRVVGARGIGKSALVARAVESFRSTAYAVPPLPEELQRKHLRVLIRDDDADRAPAEATEPTPSEVPGWGALFEELSRALEPGSAPFVLVLDDAHRLRQSRARFLEVLVNTLMDTRGASKTLHVVLVGTDEGLPDEADIGDLCAGTLSVSPLPFRVTIPLLPGKGPAEWLRAYGCFGGIPRVLTHLDRSVALETNLRRLFLSSTAPFPRAGELWL